MKDEYMDNKQKIIYTKNCLEFLNYKCVAPNDKDFRIYEGKNSVIPSMVDANFNDGFLNNWNWIMEIVETIEKTSKYTIMNKDLYSSFDIGKHSIEFYFSPNNNYLLHLELRQWLPDEIWKHSGYKYHIIKEFDFRSEGKKKAVVQAINQFLIWYNEQRT